TKVASIHFYDRSAAVQIDAVLIQPRSAPLDVHAELCRRAGHEFANGVLLARGDDVVVRLRLLQDQPLCPDVITRMAPVTHRMQVAQVETRIEPLMDASESAGNLARNERLAANRRLVVEKDSAAGKHAVSL